MTRWSPEQRSHRSHSSNGSGYGSNLTAGVVRGEDADAVRNARFDVGFSQHSQLSVELTDQLKAEARAAGYAAGWSEGRRAAELTAREAREAFAVESAAITAAQEATARRVLGALASAVDRFEERATPAVEHMQRQLVDAAFALAEEFVGRELAAAAEPGRDAIARALALAPAGRSAVARLNPTDAAGLPGTTMVDGREVVVVADPALAPGDAIVECDASTIESRVAGALDRARQALDANGTTA
jgi:flagellar assembly protein FliH